MIVTCNEEYWRFMQSMKPKGAPCGKTYDDVDHSTICPHEPLPPKLTLEQQEELLDLLRGERSEESKIRAIKLAGGM